MIDAQVVNDNKFLVDFLKEQREKGIIKPNEGKQELFASLPDDIFEALYGGAAYGGKTWILTLFPLFREFYKYRGFKGIIFRRSFPDLEKEVIRLSKEYYPKTGGVYNEQKHSWFWEEFQSYMDFGHANKSSDITSYDSAQYNYCAFDELTHFDAYPYHYMVGSRVRPGSASCNIAIARNGTNPGGIGQTFVYDRFIKPYEEGGRVLKDKETGLTRIFIPALIEDNPHGQAFDPGYAKKLEILKVVSPAEYRAKRYGDWHAFKGSVFTTFRPIRFPGEPSNALHVIPQFRIPEWWPRVLSIDWGKRAMCYAMWGAISPDRRVYVYRERAWKGRDLPFWATEIRLIHDETTELPVQTILCGSAWQNRGVELISDEFQKYSDLVPTSSENTPGSRIAGLQLVHDFLRWEKIDKLKSKGEVYLIDKAQEIYRKFGPEALERYKSQFYDEPEEENLPIMQIFDTCKVLIETIPLAQYDDKKIEDIAEFDGDDPIDDLRYFCKGVKRYLMGEIGNMDFVAKQHQIAQELEVTQDMTRFYRQMEALEKRQDIHRHTDGSVIPMSRYSRFRRRH